MEEDFFHRLKTSEYRGPCKWRMNQGGRALQTGWVRFFKLVLTMVLFGNMAAILNSVVSN